MAHFWPHIVAVNLWCKQCPLSFWIRKNLKWRFIYSLTASFHVSFPYWVLSHFASLHLFLWDFPWFLLFFFIKFSSFFKIVSITSFFFFVWSFSTHGIQHRAIFSEGSSLWSLASQLENHVDSLEFSTQVLFSINDKPFLGPAFFSLLPETISIQYPLYSSED